MIESETVRQTVLRIFESGDGGGWIAWFHESIPNEPDWWRWVIRIIAQINRHCMICTGLSGCYFVESNMPKQPHHENCDCSTREIVTPIAGITAVAYCPIEKFTEYIFNPKYAATGKGKLFESLGLDSNAAYYLKNEYEKQAAVKYAAGQYKLKKLDVYGQNIDIEIEVESSVRNGIKFISGWKVYPQGYITCNTPLGG